MSIKNRFKRFFDLDEDEYVYEETTEAPTQSYDEDMVDDRKGKQNIVSLQSIQQQSKVVLIEPRVYAEAQDIADQLKNRRSVVMNLQRISHDQAKRIVDFLSGTVYALGGDIQKLGPNTFLCTPENVDVSGSISEMQHGE
ncbi:cell division machinery factor [Fictibacillus macauensis ZFHKF-1]|uniref:Cell division protein SepF n=1 Tax=Fictibacillus macauensis ZFHKF-1 TaxID=1196324 RepID=I8AHV6_9BACL|nr:cell division protein SepF [Fictibacillus macauensis]EIT85009.1 cell division machinery factor [Fictibacillus macauensis ZFHKF-1]